MNTAATRCRHAVARYSAALLAAALLSAVSAYGDFTITLDVTDPGGTPITGGFRWLVEEDNTNQPMPGVLQPTLGDPTNISIAVDNHMSHAPVVAEGDSGTAASVAILVPDGRYVVSVLPHEGYTLSGTLVASGQTSATVIVNAFPVPTAQISVFVFDDHWPINNAPDQPEVSGGGLAGVTIVVSDAAGQLMQDVYGNPLANAYLPTETGTIQTDADGRALIKNLAPGKYGLQVIPPAGEGWIQTTTLEGTHTIDAWVKAGEPPVFVEFGPAGPHVFVGFAKQTNLLDTLPNPGGQTTTISGTVRINHFSQPPNLVGPVDHPGPPVEDLWVGLNEAFSRQGVYAAPGNPDGTFSIAGIPPGTYQLVTWDENMDTIFGFNNVVVPAVGQPASIELGNVLAFAWFGTLEGSVFYDTNMDGFPDEGELGMPEQGVLLRFRDGTVYQATATDLGGDYSFDEVFPFFKWLVVEVDFLRYWDTGFTNVVDLGGAIPGAAWPAEGKRNPQPQPENGGLGYRTESGFDPGAFLLQAVHLFLGQNNRIDWGKAAYGPGQSGGISGIVYYAVTRAENDPRYAAAEEWEPGIPRVQVNLYQDADCDGVIDDLNGDGVPTRADVDNYPLGWGSPSGGIGDEDIDWNGNTVFDPGDAIQITHTDSWDDDPPTGCVEDPGNPLVVHGVPIDKCFDNFATWNQVRPGVFDGGFAIWSHHPGGMASGSAAVDDIPPGTYIVEAAEPAGYQTLKEENRNVDFGEEYSEALPPPCVGEDHLVPAELTLFPGEPAPYAGEMRPLCNLKLVEHSYGQNTGVEFFMLTEVPKAARAVGFINNDLAAEFDQTSPVFGEKQAPSWLPISFQDYAGNEIARIYSDEFGAYNALLPSSFTVNVPSPTGVSPHMISFVINHPGPIDDGSGNLVIDPWFDANYGQTPYTFNFESGKTTYLDTPVIPVAAFAGYPNRMVDAEPADETPVLYSVEGPSGGPVVCNSGDTITLTSLGADYSVPNPFYDPTDPLSPVLITRDFSFGNTQGTVTLGNASLAITSWTEDTIVATVEEVEDGSGRLLVTRGDNDLTTPIGVTLHDCSTAVVHVTGGGTWPNTPIQDAIDAATAGTLIIVEPGTYKENPIIWKAVKLQGSGAGSTFINGNPVPFERVSAWHDKIAELIAAGHLNPQDPGFFEAIEAPTVFVHGSETFPFTESNTGLVDGFTIMGGVSGGGVYLADRCNDVQVSCNRITNNQGTWGGGVVIGINDQETSNEDVWIVYNRIAKNGGTTGGGGVTIFTGAVNYRLADNLIIGNFSRSAGGGVAHIGMSKKGTIARNQIVFNEVFSGNLFGSSDGGGIYLGLLRDIEDPRPLNLGSGTGTVTIDSNLIQGNLAGAGSGGGVRAFGVNGEDARRGNERQRNQLRMYNNIIVNNVAGLRGGGVALTDVVEASLIHNTIADNDSTATAALAFPPGTWGLSTAQPAGLVITPHSPQLAVAAEELAPDPELINNIFWKNRSYYWDATQYDPAVEGSGVMLDGFNDLELYNAPAGYALHPQYCVITNAGAWPGPGNTSDDPAFTTEYNNGLLAAFVLDEGGNRFTIRYRELLMSNGDYHIETASTAIVDAALDVSVQNKDYPELKTDVDGDNREIAAKKTANGDIGADEIVGGDSAAPAGKSESEADGAVPSKPVFKGLERSKVSSAGLKKN